MHQEVEDKEGICDFQTVGCLSSFSNRIYHLQIQRKVEAGDWACRGRLIRPCTGEDRKEAGLLAKGSRHRRDGPCRCRRPAASTWSVNAYHELTHCPSATSHFFRCPVSICRLHTLFQLQNVCANAAGSRQEVLARACPMAGDAGHAAPACTSSKMAGAVVGSGSIGQP